MRRLLTASALAAALALSACGNDATDDPIAEVQTQAEQAVDQLDAEGAVTETQQLVDDVTGSARELVEDPAADVDARLEDAEQRARELSDRVETELAGDQPELADALSTANDQLAQAAADLRDVTTSAEATRVVEEELAQLGDRLRDAVGDPAGEVSEEARRQLDQAREEVERLQRELPGLGEG